MENREQRDFVSGAAARDKGQVHFEEWKTGEYIRRAKNNEKEAVIFIINKLEPLLNKYVKKLYFMEREDAYQELVLALLEGILKVNDYSSDYACLSYLVKTIRHKYCFLCKKHFRKEENETQINDEDLKIIGVSDQTSEIITAYLLRKLLKGLTEQERKIMTTLILQGTADADIARELNVSRQYIYKVKKRVCKKWKEVIK